MKRRLTRVVGSIVLTSAFLGIAQNTLAQDSIDKVTRSAQKHYVRDHAKLARWLERMEAKRAKELTNEQRFDTAYTARGSEIRMIDSTGQYVSLGYVDKRNDMKLHRQ
jgi:hypothetical protein